jgi:hypothetical protein
MLGLFELYSFYTITLGKQGFETKLCWFNYFIFMSQFFTSFDFFFVLPDSIFHSMVRYGMVR